MPTATFDMPYPVSKNKWNRAHWASRERVIKSWASDIGWLVKKHRIPKALPQVRVDLEVVCRRSGALPDPQNVIGQPHECIADALVKAGVLVDDGARAATGYVWPYVQGSLKLRRVIDREQPKTIVTVSWESPVASSN